MFSLMLRSNRFGSAQISSISGRRSRPVLSLSGTIVPTTCRPTISASVYPKNRWPNSLRNVIRPSRDQRRMMLLASITSSRYSRSLARSAPSMRLRSVMSRTIACSSTSPPRSRRFKLTSAANGVLSSRQCSHSKICGPSVSARLIFSSAFSSESRPSGCTRRRELVWRRADDLLSAAAEHRQRPGVAVDEAVVAHQEDRVARGLEQRAVLELALAQRLLHAFLLGDVANDLDGAAAPALLVEQGRRLSPEMRPLAASQARDEGLGAQHVALPLDVLVVRLHLGRGRVEQIDEDRAPLPEERLGIGVVPLAEQRLLRHSGHDLARMVPGDNPLVPVDHEGGVRQEFDDARKQLIRVLLQQGLVRRVHALQERTLRVRRRFLHGSRLSPGGDVPEESAALPTAADGCHLLPATLINHLPHLTSLHDFVPQRGGKSAPPRADRGSPLDFDPARARRRRQVVLQPRITRFADADEPGRCRGLQ